MYLSKRYSKIVSLTSSLVVKMLTALVSTVSNSVIFAEKNVSSFILAHMLYLMIKVLMIH